MADKRIAELKELGELSEARRINPDQLANDFERTCDEVLSAFREAKSLRTGPVVASAAKHEQVRTRFWNAILRLEDQQHDLADVFGELAGSIFPK